MATFPVGADGAGEGTAALTPTATMHYRAAEKAWRAEYERPRETRPVAGGGLTGCPTPTGGTHPPGRKPCVVGGGGGGGLGG